MSEKQEYIRNYMRGYIKNASDDHCDACDCTYKSYRKYKHLQTTKHKRNQEAHDLKGQNTEVKDLAERIQQLEELLKKKA